MPPRIIATGIVNEDFIITMNERLLNFSMVNIPGHTLDHVAFYTNGNLFTGDTLFSCGCGRVFEGTHEQLFQSLQTLSSFPDETKIYCGHEYTLNNLKFAKEVEPSNRKILEKIEMVSKLLEAGKPSLPSILREEKEVNPFLRCHVPQVKEMMIHKAALNLDATANQVFYHIREWKDKFTQ